MTAPAYLYHGNLYCAVCGSTLRDWYTRQKDNRARHVRLAHFVVTDLTGAHCAGCSLHVV